MASFQRLQPVFGIVLLLVSQSVGVIDTVKDAIDNTNDHINDLILEPVGDAIEKTMDTVADMTDKAKEQMEEINENIVDPYKNVMSMLKIDHQEDFTEEVLETFLDTFSSKFHCKLGLFKRSTMCTRTMVSASCQISMSV